MTRETAADKARRYLVEGRVVVVEVRPGYSRAIVRGTSELHEVVEDGAGRTCTCPAVRTCSHVLAVGLVTPPALAALVAPPHARARDPRVALRRAPDGPAAPAFTRTPRT